MEDPSINSIGDILLESENARKILNLCATDVSTAAASLAQINDKLTTRLICLSRKHTELARENASLKAANDSLRFQNASLRNTNVELDAVKTARTRLATTLQRDLVVARRVRIEDARVLERLMSRVPDARAIENLVGTMLGRRGLADMYKIQDLQGRQFIAPFLYSLQRRNNSRLRMQPLARTVTGYGGSGNIGMPGAHEMDAYNVEMCAILRTLRDTGGPGHYFNRNLLADYQKVILWDRFHESRDTGLAAFLFNALSEMLAVSSTVDWARCLSLLQCLATKYTTSDERYWKWFIDNVILSEVCFEDLCVLSKVVFGQFVRTVLPKPVALRYISRETYNIVSRYGNTMDALLHLPSLFSPGEKVEVFGIRLKPSFVFLRLWDKLRCIPSGIQTVCLHSRPRATILRQRQDRMGQVCFYIDGQASDMLSGRPMEERGAQTGQVYWSWGVKESPHYDPTDRAQLHAMMREWP
ncbi:hypothetical protein BDZ85DRAFT_286417 [Elsinoe ampelina]|uniref:Uncharacterized protein n=1 Tax=Elsinoe ampelina TaxID=302913 RepID=A0A6A6FY72_9PEZI|nr:hypothetical protein BDZ85DRAFT_286417 [Elsinoe ampelina]